MLVKLFGTTENVLLYCVGFISFMALIANTLGFHNNFQMIFCVMPFGAVLFGGPRRSSLEPTQETVNRRSGAT